MRSRILKTSAIALLAWVLALMSVLNAQESQGALFAASDGKGGASLIWFPPPSRWPAAWRVMDSSGQVLAPQIKMGDESALQTLSVEDADAIRKLPAVLASPASNPARRKQLINILGLRAFSEPGYARALGLSYTIQSAAPGPHAYKVVGLDSSGQPTGLVLTSRPVDSSQATVLPQPPDQVQAKVSDSGVGIGWAAPPENRDMPVITYAIERDGGGQSGALVTPKPVVVGTHWKSDSTLVLDRNAPPNEMLTYRIYSIDVFGRRSQAGLIRIFFPDFRAMVPPEPVHALAQPGKITVSWNGKQKPNLSGYVVERAFLESGPYEVLTTQALPAATVQYDDMTIRGGTAYYYRVRAVSPRGDLGPPTHSALASAANPDKPPTVAGVTADVGDTRVRLTWPPVSVPVAGYFIERRAITGTAAAENWVRLNAHVTREPLYDDYLGATSDTKLDYRVLAIGFDNGEGLPSDPVHIAIQDRSLPGTPSITGASGANAKAVLTFVPALPEAKSAQFLILRSGRREDIGLVMGDPLATSARRFADAYVAPGETYWYRVVAVDNRGNRSDPSAPVVIRVGSAAIPKPQIPMAQLIMSLSPQVMVQFQKAPVGLGVVLERQDSPSAGWIRVAGPMQDQSAATDTAPPQQGRILYRVTYVSADGKLGDASDPVAIVIKR